MRLADIAVHVESGQPDDLLGGGVIALLHEIAEMLEALYTEGLSQAIDVRSLPLAPGELERLREVLGTGEVEATIEAEGLSTVHETSIPGVWWIQHHDAGGAVVAELIDVSRIPEILLAADDDIGRGATILRERIARGGRSE